MYPATSAAVTVANSKIRQTPLPHAALIAAWGSVLRRNDSSLYPFETRTVISRSSCSASCLPRP